MRTRPAPCLAFVISSGLATGACTVSGDAAGDETGTATAGTAGGETGTPGPVANGELGPWRSGPALPEPKANHCSIVVDGRLLVLGGNHRPEGEESFVRSDAVHAASIAEDGSLGDWVQIGTTPSPVQQCVVTAHEDGLILLGGVHDDEAHGSEVWSASFAEDGSLREWVSIGSLPTHSHELLFNSGHAWVHGSTLFVQGTMLPQDGDATFLARAELGESLGPWELDEWLLKFRFQGHYGVRGNFFYSVGGYGESGILRDAFVGVIGEDGVVTDFRAGADLPAATAFGEGAAVDDYFFVVAGRDELVGGGLYDAVYSARLEDDGRNGEWKALEPLPVALSNQSLAVGERFLFVSGGGADGVQFDTVYAAQVRFDPE